MADTTDTTAVTDNELIQLVLLLDRLEQLEPLLDHPVFLRAMHTLAVGAARRANELNPFAALGAKVQASAPSSSAPVRRVRASRADNSDLDSTTDDHDTD